MFQAQLEQADIRLTDKIVIEQLIAENEEMQQYIAADIVRTDQKLLREIKSNPKAFFKYANSKRKVKTKIGPLQSGSSLESGPKEMAEILSAQYESVFSSPLEDLPTANMANQTYQALVDIDITEELVREAVENMDENSAPGLDGITAYFLKTYIDQLLYPIIRMWRNSRHRPTARRNCYCLDHPDIQRWQQKSSSKLQASRIDKPCH